MTAIEKNFSISLLLLLFFSEFSATTVEAKFRGEKLFDPDEATEESGRFHGNSVDRSARIGGTGQMMGMGKMMGAGKMTGAGKKPGHSVEAWVCNPVVLESRSNPTRLLPKKISGYDPVSGSKSFKQGEAITMCVATDDETFANGVVISGLKSFTWERETTKQKVMLDDRPGSCKYGWCTFSSTLHSDFFHSSGEVNGIGSASVEFQLRRHLTSSEDSIVSFNVAIGVYSNGSGIANGSGVANPNAITSSKPKRKKQQKDDEQQENEQQQDEPNEKEQEQEEQEDTEKDQQQEGSSSVIETKIFKREEGKNKWLEQSNIFRREVLRKQKNQLYGL